MGKFSEDAEIQKEINIISKVLDDFKTSKDALVECVEDNENKDNIYYLINEIQYQMNILLESLKRLESQVIGIVDNEEEEKLHD